MKKKKYNWTCGSQKYHKTVQHECSDTTTDGKLQISRSNSHISKYNIHDMINWLLMSVHA